MTFMKNAADKFGGRRIAARLLGTLLAVSLLGGGLTVNGASRNEPATTSADKPTEASLIAVLQSDATPAEKAITCKRLAVFGSEAAVPALAPLLVNPELASWARIALEAIPG